MSNKSINPDFWTSVHDTKKTRDKNYIKRQFEEKMIGKLKIHAQSVYNNTLLVEFGAVEIEDYRNDNKLFVPILFYNVILSYEDGRNSRIISVRVERNNLKFPY